MKPQLVVALDVGSLGEAEAVAGQLPSEAAWFKVGLELFTCCGSAAVELLRKRGKRVFLDLKLHDIPNTVSRAVSAAARLGASLVTVHASGGKAMLEAAVQAARSDGGGSLKILAVTVLTSLDDKDLSDLGVNRPVAEQAMALGETALGCGVDGLVCSPREVRSLRSRFGDAPLLATPGIRLESGDIADQKRIGTPESAVADGSDFLVVGRPVLAAADPRAAASELLRRINAAWKESKEG